MFPGLNVLGTPFLFMILCITHLSALILVILRTVYAMFSFLRPKFFALSLALHVLGTPFYRLLASPFFYSHYVPHTQNAPFLVTLCTVYVILQPASLQRPKFVSLSLALPVCPRYAISV